MTVPDEFNEGAKFLAGGEGGRGGGGGGAQPTGGEPTTQHIFDTWPSWIGEVMVSRMKNILGLESAEGADGQAVFAEEALGSPLGKYAHFGFGLEVGTDCKTGPTGTQLPGVWPSVMVDCVMGELV